MKSLTDLIVPRLPHRPYCTNKLTHGVVIRPAAIACTKNYLQLNPAVLRHWLTFDLDFPMASIAWESVNLAPPNWIAVNTQNSHAHYGYLLETPVVMSASGRDKPLRYAAAIESAFRIKLHADPGYSGLLVKNPLNGAWLTLFLHANAYSLGELSEWVSLKKTKSSTIEETGLLRNVTLFETLREWSYRTVLAYKKEAASLDLWLHAVLREAESINRCFKPPLSVAEVRAVARSVAKWVWRMFHPELFSKIQQARAVRRWSKPQPPSIEKTKPWEEMGISRRTYYYRKKAGLLLPSGCTDAISDISNSGAAQ